MVKCLSREVGEGVGGEGARGGGGGGEEIWESIRTFSGRVTPATSTMVFGWLPRQAPGITRG